MGISEDHWLSERFGRPVLTVGADAGAAEVREHAAAGGAAFYQARVPADDVNRVVELQRAGLRVVNTGLTLGRDGGAVGTDKQPGIESDLGAPGVAVREGVVGRDEEACEIARVAFRYDRFHLDPEVPDEVADRIKHDWVDNTLRGLRGERLLVAEHDGQIVGFLAVIVKDDVSMIDLTAVHPAARGRGIGRALAAHFLRGASRAEVGTQAANDVATRFYEGLGFRTVRAAYDLHMTV